MNKPYLSHDELQHVEHCNKVLEAHLELVNAVCSLSEEKMNELINSFAGYVNALKGIQNDMATVTKNIYQSARELKVATGGTQDLMSYCAAIDKLNNTLDDKLIGKLRRISNE